MKVRPSVKKICDKCKIIQIIYIIIPQLQINVKIFKKKIYTLEIVYLY